MKQGQVEGIFTYSPRIEKLQNQIIEQVITEYPVEVVSAVEQTIIKQVL